MVSKLKKFYVTTAIDYVNGSPHIGHALEKVHADVLARFHKIKGEKVFFLTGTDEHGIKVKKAADEAGLEPQKFVDKITKEFKTAWEALDIEFDRFIRTTDKDHEEGFRKFILKIKKDDIYKGNYEGHYCSGCEAFLMEKELVDGNCVVHKRKAEFITEENYFFKLSNYQKKLLEFYENNPNFIWPRTRREEIINRVKEGLHDISVTREKLKWGIPFPLDEKHITHVWIEALSSYITALGFPDNKNFETFWPADAHLIGKDISWFHCVIWPALLIAANIEPPKKVLIHGYITLNGNKISKSLGNVIDPRELVKKYGKDSVRYFILREIPSTEDGDFSEKLLIERHNKELANDLGNLVNRILVLTEKKLSGKIPQSSETYLAETCKETAENVEKHTENYHLHLALNEIWKLIGEANKLINDKKPWELEGKEVGEILYCLLESLRHISILLYPLLPSTSIKIMEQLELGEKDIAWKNLKWGGLKSGSTIKRGEILFKKIEVK